MRKRMVLTFFTILLLILPVSASVLGSSQVILAATEEGYSGACTDVSLGSYVADTMRQAGNTDLALLPTGLLGLNLPSGVVDADALALSLPLDEAVYTVTLTAVQLKELLESSAAPLTLDERERLDREISIWDGFLQVSGLHIIYNVPALVGSRLYELKLDDGSEPELTDEALTFTVALPASLLDGTYGYPTLTPQTELGTLRSLTAERIAREGIVQEPDSRRIILYGAHENDIINSFPPLLIVFVVLLFAVFGGHKWRRAARFER